MIHCIDAFMFNTFFSALKKPSIVTNVVNTEQMFSINIVPFVPCRAHFTLHCRTPTVQPGVCWQKSRLHSSPPQHKHASVPLSSISHKNLILYLQLQQETQSKPTWVHTPPPSPSQERKLHHRSAMKGSRSRQKGRTECTPMKVRQGSENHILSIVLGTLTLGFVCK